MLRKYITVCKDIYLTVCSNKIVCKFKHPCNTGIYCILLKYVIYKIEQMITEYGGAGKLVEISKINVAGKLWEEWLYNSRYPHLTLCWILNIKKNKDMNY